MGIVLKHWVPWWEDKKAFALKTKVVILVLVIVLATNLLCTALAFIFGSKNILVLSFSIVHNVT